MPGESGAHIRNIVGPVKVRQAADVETLKGRKITENKPTAAAISAKLQWRHSLFAFRLRLYVRPYFLHFFVITFVLHSPLRFLIQVHAGRHGNAASPKESICLSKERIRREHQSKLFARYFEPRCSRRSALVVRLGK